MIGIEHLDKAFENRIRLGIMAILSASGEADFNALKRQLGVSDGNLASHIRALEELGFIETRKQFIGRKPNTSYLITEQGRNAFEAHVNALAALLNL
ncbi:MAG: transcriptional regulator, partial [Bacteroidaceae bacterium]|nr:transcriptional regulator [Bacteroidaceae bacterium]